MKICRLKIITANILDNIDIPKIHYVSQAKQTKKTISYNKDQNNLFHNIDTKAIQKETPEKINEDKNQIKSKEIINYLEKINEEKTEKEKNNNNNKIAEENTEIIGINDLCTISNKDLKAEQKINNIINYLDNNYNEDKFTNSNYPYTIMNKKKGLNNSLRHLFKNRETRTNPNKNYKSSNQSLSMSKISINNINAKKCKTKNSSKVNLKLSQSINFNKSLAMKDSKSSDCMQLKKNKKIIKTNKSININDQSNKSKKNSVLKSKKGNPETNENMISTSSWKISEKNDLYNIGQIIDYKILIDDLVIKECNLIKEKEKCIEIFEQKLKPLREKNKQLLNSNNEELNREDELKGELILLKSQYEKLFNTLNPKDKKIIKEYNNIKTPKKEVEDKEFNEKQKKIEDEIKALNDQLKKGEFIFVTKPPNYQKLSEEDNNDMIILLKGLLISKHILNSDIIIDKIWKLEKPFQTIYFLVEEFFDFFNLEKHDRNKLIYFFYSFCKNYSYMNITEFKKEFKKAIGKISIYNKYIYFSKLLNFYKSKIVSLMKSIKKKDIFNRGVINYYTFNRLLYDCGISFNKSSDKDFQEIFEFLIFCMKKDRKISLFEKDNNFFEDKEEKKNSLFDLYYECLDDFINEFKAKEILNPYSLIRNYMNENEIVNAENLLKPILSDKNILVINSIKYIDIIILNKYLRFKGIIKEDEKIEVNTLEEELVNINKFINDIYSEKGVEKKEDFVEIKHKAENLIDDILKLNF